MQIEQRTTLLVRHGAGGQAELKAELKEVGVDMWIDFIFNFTFFLHTPDSPTGSWLSKLALQRT